MHCRNTRTPNRGFTLIELLVVIAIIAILAAILFPVFAQAREQARKTVCLSNVKQISLGNMMYIQDYDETFEFAWGVPATPGSDGTWLDALMPYVKNGQQNETVAGNNNWHYSTGLWNCPSDSEGPSKVSYTTNALETGASNGVGDDLAPETLAAINAPSSVVMIAESNKAYNIEAPAIPGWDDTGTDLVRCQADLGVDKGSDAAAFFYRDWIHNQDYTDVQWTPITGCPPGPAYAGLTYPDGWNCKYPAFRHNRTGQKSGIANFAFSDGHAKSFRYGAMKIENWFPSPTPTQLNFDQ
jgi:prepilin-type N-terminal cleavage/methylation domain-containing protein/prepilin-type processing-associated H-X9-DG protein